METSILIAVEAEQQQLEKQLSKLDSEYAAKKKLVITRLDAIKTLRLAYGVDNRVLPVANTKYPVVYGVPLPPSHRENSHKARVLATALEILKGGASVRTAELLKMIEERGVEFKAANKAGNLSVILSKDNRFVSDRRNGWSLAEKNPQDAPTSAGSGAANAASN